MKREDAYIIDSVLSLLRHRFRRQIQALDGPLYDEICLAADIIRVETDAFCPAHSTLPSDPAWAVTCELARWHGGKHSALKGEVTW